MYNFANFIDTKKYLALQRIWPEIYCSFKKKVKGFVVSKVGENMDIYIYIYIYVYRYTYVYIYIYTYIHVYIEGEIEREREIHTYMCIIYIYIHTYTYIYIYIYTCVYVCTRYVTVLHLQLQRCEVVHLSGGSEGDY